MIKYEIHNIDRTIDLYSKGEKMRKFINNKCMRLILPNVVIVLTCMIITLCVLDYYNPLMGFLSRGMSLGVIAIWILSLLLYLGATCIRVFLYRKR